jgi:hypothetical protein
VVDFGVRHLERLSNVNRSELVSGEVLR